MVHSPTVHLALGALLICGGPCVWYRWVVEMVEWRVGKRTRLAEMQWLASSTERPHTIVNNACFLPDGERGQATHMVHSHTPCTFHYRLTILPSRCTSTADLVRIMCGPGKRAEGAAPSHEELLELANASRQQSTMNVSDVARDSYRSPTIKVHHTTDGDGSQ